MFFQRVEPPSSCKRRTTVCRGTTRSTFASQLAKKGRLRLSVRFSFERESFMHGEILRPRVLLIVTMLWVPAGMFSVAAQQPAQTQRGVITTFAPIVEKVAPSVVTVFTTQTVSRGLTTFPFGDDTLRQFFGGQSPQRQDKQTLQGLGSGVIVSPDGYILTANHVVSGAEEIMVGLGTELRKYKAKKVGTDPGTDVALLKIDEKNLPAITFADSEKARAGDIVLAVGNPFGLRQTLPWVSSAPSAAAVWGSLIMKISSRRTQRLTWATRAARWLIRRGAC
jgi:hypothetical protein